IRSLLIVLGYDSSRFRFFTAPRGQGDPKAWLSAQYPSEVNLLRRKNFQYLCLITSCDGDNVGFVERKREFDGHLRTAGFVTRQAADRIALPTPTWSIETWLLFLLGDDNVDESESSKEIFERRFRKDRDEGGAIRDASQAWAARVLPGIRIESLLDAK